MSVVYIFPVRHMLQDIVYMSQGRKGCRVLSFKVHVCIYYNYAKILSTVAEGR